MEKLLVAKNRDYVRGTEYFVKNSSQDYHCADGVFKKADLDSKEGMIISTNTGKEFYLLEANFFDKYKRIKRLAQIIPRKDIGLILTETGIGKNSVVFDMGAGSGALTILLSQFVKKVRTYDIREDHLELVKKNCEVLGIKNVVAVLHDVYLGLPDKNADLVTLDLSEPWKMLDPVSKSLKKNCFVVSYSPTIPQVMDFVAAVKKHPDFLHEKTIEILEREWEIEERKVRPMSQMMGHSGFLTFVRKIQ